MKIIKLLPIIALAIMVALGACSSEELMQDVKPDASAQDEERALLLTATMPGEGVATRVGLTQEDDKSITLTWKADDEIKLLFVQGKTRVIYIAEVATLSTDKKKATFKMLIPELINLKDTFDLYGVYGGGDIDISGEKSIVTLPVSAGSATSLGDVETRKDVMLSFSNKGIDIANGNISTAFAHLGSLFSITLKNTGTQSLHNLHEAQIVGVDNGVTEWAFNNAEGGQQYDLVKETFPNSWRGGNYISFATSQSNLSAGDTITFWAWYPLGGRIWPDLQLQLKNATASTIAISANNLLRRSSAPSAGKSYYFYAAWDGTELNFTNEAFSNDYTVHVAEMGTLGALLTSAEKGVIKKLTLTGQINEADYEVMRLKMPSLQHLDISQVTSYEDATPNIMPSEAFKDHNAITSIVFPKSITSIGDLAFAGTKLAGVLKLPASLKTIGQFAFYETDISGPLTFPAGLETIGQQAFYKCKGLTEVVIPNGVTTIENVVFMECSNITSLTLPASLKTIKHDAFNRCTSLKSLTLPDNLETIGAGAFDNCISISGNVLFPNSLESIEYNTFVECNNIASFQFLNTIPIPYTTRMLTEGKPVIVPANAVAAYKEANGWYPRHPIVSLIDDYDYTVVVRTKGTLSTLLTAEAKANIVKLTVTGQINKADFNVMRNEMPMLTYVDLSAVTCDDNKIPDNAFGGDNNPNKTIKTIILPLNITSIGNRAFRGCSGLTGNLTIPDQVAVIEPDAFFDCVNLTGSLIIPNSVTKIGSNAFRSCRGFNSLIMSQNIKIIGWGPFYNCSGLTGTVKFPHSLTQIEDSGFYGCSGVETFQFLRSTPITYTDQMLPSGKPVTVPASAVSAYKTAWGTSRHTITGF